jgi:sterol desaturase/sphingolipid hydroxylase (fatty acid hydroxylase superfamily)
MTVATFPSDSVFARALYQRVALLGGFLLYAAALSGVWWEISHLMPDTATLHVLSRTLVLKNIHDKIFANALLILFLLPSALWLEMLLVGWQDSSCRALLVGRTNSICSDLACFFLDQAHLMGVLGRVMMLGGAMLSGVWLRDLLHRTTGLAIDPSALPLAVQVVLYFYAYSFFDYWTHRVGHHRLFWPLHRYHHSAQDFCVVNATRIHPAGFVQIFLINMPMAVLGAPVDAMIQVNVATVALGFIIHSRIDSDFGWAGRWLIQSPLHHRAHHKLDMTHPTQHFSMAPVWDRLFGTWGGEATADMAIGVDTNYRGGFFVLPDLLRDYWDFWKGLAGRRDLSPSERT